jgi:hypothetical protein
MIRIEKSVKAAPDAVLRKAKNQFGSEGLGLTVSDAQETCVEFSGGGGFVSVTACRDNGKTQVEITSREWDQQAKSFMASLR